MTDELTLREKVLNMMEDSLEFDLSTGTILDLICEALVDTGSPAHMRVAKELRGE